MKIYHPLLLALVCAFPSSAWAQWQWLDQQGNKVFSDRAPPLDVPEKNILKQPSEKVNPRPSPSTAVPAPVPAAAAAAASKPHLAVKDKELEEKKARAEAAEAAKKKAEEDKMGKLRSENCTRAQSAKARFDTGQLLRHTNAQGESVFMDESTRTAELRRIQEIVAEDCKR